MIRFTHGNLLDADTDAIVNTVNTVGVMGKGIALMFKEAFPENFKAYAAACKRNEIQVGHMFVTERHELLGPRWIVNFPTKRHWRHPSKLEWITEGLEDLKKVIVERGIRSIALPPLGSGNGRLDWNVVRLKIEEALEPLQDVEVIVFEPTAKYQNVAKRQGVETLTPARALVAELVRRYWILGIECSLLEIQKLAYFLERQLDALGPGNPLDLKFEANKFGPYAPRLTHLLNALDGSYLHCHKRLADAGPFDVIWFDDARTERVALYLATEGRDYLRALEATTQLINGFESPLGMELLATVDWLVSHDDVKPTIQDVKIGLAQWAGGSLASARKQKLFDDRLLQLALDRLNVSV